MDRYNHFQYVEQLSRRLRFLRSGYQAGRKVFYTSPHSDTLYAISQKLSEINHPVIIAVNGYDADYSDNDADALFEKSQYFIILLQPAPPDSPEHILTAQHTCKQNALQIQARLMADSRAYRAGLTNLLPDTFTIRSIGPMADNLYGVVLGYNVDENIHYTLNPSMWL